MEEFLTPENVAFVVGGLVTFLTAMGVFSKARKAFGDFFDHLAQKTKLGFLANVDEILIGFATDLYRSEIKVLKASGEWNQATKDAMFGKLKDKAKEHFGFASLAALAGGGSPAEVESFVSSRANLAIDEAKNRGKAVDPSEA